MNFRRGLRRLFLVLAICYYVIGGAVIFWDWQYQGIYRSACLSAIEAPLSVRDGIAGATNDLQAQLQDGTILHFPTGTSPAVVQEVVKRHHDAHCLDAYPPAREWTETFAFVLLPALAYAFWKVVAWIGR